MDFWTPAAQEIPLAKPQETYQEHVEKVIRFHLQLWPQTENFWRRLGQLLIDEQLYQDTPNRFLKRVDAGLRIACLTHDIGKLNHGFHQYMCAMRRKEAGEQYIVKENWYFRHELLSLPFTDFLSREIGKTLGALPSALPWETVAVMGHHKLLTHRLFEREGGRMFKPVSADSDGMLYPEMLREVAWGWVKDYLLPEMSALAEMPDKFWQACAQALQQGRAGIYLQQLTGLTQGVSNTSNNRQKSLLRYFGAAFKGHLQICDWWASAPDPVSIYGIDTHQAAPLRKTTEASFWLKERLAAALSPPTQAEDLRWRDFQKQVAVAGNYAACIAPTGSGKTEAALLWALKQIQRRPDLSRIVYLLPTTTTANALHQRLMTFFGNSLVGIAHSKAKLLRYGEQFAEEDDGEIRQSVLFESAFIPPVTVATLDQLLLTGLHGKHWVFRQYGLSQSVIILDELHAFDPYTLGLLGKSLEQLKLLEIPVLALSATFPQPLQQLFGQWFPEAETIRDTALLQESRSRWEFREQSDFNDDAFLLEIAEKMSAGQRFLIVRNTVKGAQETYRRLKNLQAPVRLLHSRFVYRDRLAIEEQIFDDEQNDGKISLVSTQIVEVSLDIDYDHLVSELCPPDALVQRAGRCNRKRRKPDATVTVLPADKSSAKIYEKKFGAGNLLQKSAEALKTILSSQRHLREEDLLNWVNLVYRETELQELDLFKEGSADLRKTQQNLHYILDYPAEEEQLQTRWIRRQKVPVIPKSIWYNLSESDQERIFKNPLERALYIVEIPFWRRKELHNKGLAMQIRFKKQTQEQTLDYLYWVDLPYDADLGLQFPSAEEQVSSGTSVI